MSDCQPVEINKDEVPCTIKIFVSKDLYRAFHRCLWLRVNETGKDRIELMREMVSDFIVKHGC